MSIKTRTHWNFECENCPRYVKARPRYMGFCVIKNKKTGKKDTCQKNPTHRAFLFHMFVGVPPNLAMELAMKEAER